MTLEHMLPILDYALLAFMVGLGLYYRRARITLLALVQALVVVLRELGPEHAESTAKVFSVDGFSFGMILLITVIGSLVALYAVNYMAAHEHHQHLKRSRQPRFFFFLTVFLAAMIGLVSANDLTWLFFFWEITTLCSFMLISHDGTEEALRSGFLALEINLIGGIAFAAALLILSKAGIPLFLSDLVHAAPTKAVLIGAGLLAIAAMTKAAQLPFERWLLGAMVAPTPVSALLHSSTMVKAGVYLLLRLSPLFHGNTVGTMVTVIGAFTFAVTAACAVGESNGKRILAYSTMGNLGLIVTCAGLGTPLALSAGVVLVFFHAISKGLLFLCMGLIEQNIGSRNVEDMDALLVRMPFTTIMMVVGMFSMLLPPFGVLIGKWVTMEAAAREPVALILVVLGSALTLFYWAKWLGRVLSGQFTAPWRWERLGGLSRVALFVLASLVVATSAAIVPLLKVISGPVSASLGVANGLSTAGGGIVTKVGFFQPGPVYYVLGILLVLLPVVWTRVRPATIRAPYLCGENAAEAGLSFRSAGDNAAQAHVGGYYLTRIVPQEKLAFWADAGAILLLVVMLGVVLL